MKQCLAIISVALLIVLIGSAITTITVFYQEAGGRSSSKPNFIIFLADDTGYADLSSFGHPIQEKGAIDRMAEEGIMFTQWTSASSICSPSRSAILTGRYPIRNGIYGNNSAVIVYNTVGGLPKNETTLAEALTELGYVNGFVGKWHLGCNKYNASDGSNLPSHHGFQYVGTTFPFTSNGDCDPKMFTVEEMKPQCFLFNNTKIVQQPVDFSTVTEKLVHDAKQFITSNFKDSFYLQFSFPQTHIPLFCNEMFCEKSKRGIYGDNVNEMAWAVGQILDLLKGLQIDQDTLSLFLSDHGPDVTGCPWGGSSGVFRGGKGSTWEGGMRVPAIAMWPGTLSKGVVSESVVSSLDIFPTFLYLAGDPNYAQTRNLTIDGVVIKELVNEINHDKVERDILFYYCSDRLMGVRYKQYKIHFATHRMREPGYAKSYEIPECTKFALSLYANYSCYGKHIDEWNPPMMFDLSLDPGENYVLDPSKKKFQDVLLAVHKLILKHKASIVHVEPEIDKPFGKKYAPCCNPPTCVCNYE